SSTPAPATFLATPPAPPAAPPIISLPLSSNALVAFCPSPPSRPVICWVTRFPATFISSPSSDFNRSVGSLSAIFSRVEVCSATCLTSVRGRRSAAHSPEHSETGGSGHPPNRPGHGGHGRADCPLPQPTPP